VEILSPLWRDINLNREPIIDKCIGCDKVTVGPERGIATCLAYLYPASKWRFGLQCPLASNIKKDIDKMKKFEDPLKKSKKLSKVKK
jgi:hypothetical protein